MHIILIDNILHLLFFVANSTRLDPVLIAGFVRERNRSHAIGVNATDDDVVVVYGLLKKMQTNEDGYSYNRRNSQSD